MRVDFVRRAVHDVNTPAVGFPARNSRSEMLIGISDAAVVFLFVFVLFRVRRGVAALPEGFNKVVAFFVVRELLKGGSFLVGNDPNYVLVQPLLVDPAEFDLERFPLLLLLFIRGRALERIDFVRGLRLRASRRAGTCGARCGCARSRCAGRRCDGRSRFVTLGSSRAGNARGDSQDQKRREITSNQPEP